MFTVLTYFYIDFFIIFVPVILMFLFIFVLTAHMKTAHLIFVIVIHRAGK